MKRTMLFLLLTFSISYSQEILNPKSLTGINFNSSTFNRDFIKTNFTYGWNWSSPGVKLDNALNINAHHNQYRFTIILIQNTKIG